MSDMKRIVAGMLLWVGVVSGLHMRMNVDLLNDQLPFEKRKIM